VFEERMRGRARHRLERHRELRRAAEQEQFWLSYQPEVRLADGAIIGAEALLRWAHPRRGVVLPDDFIALAEETGLIVPIGRWALAQACQEAARWRGMHAGDEPTVVSVNLSGRQLCRPGFAEVVASVLDGAELEPERLRLEITESVLMHDAAATVTVLKELKTLGVSLAVDDFGTGYSSLAYLQRFPVDILKIDQSFIEGVGTDADRSQIVRAIIELGHSFGLEVLAEGVETAHQERELRRLGCERAQGYNFAPPLAAEEFGDLLRRAVKW
jgi:EAL domain-containing protein (putative c-di-GMP-specific phosphodiesterase class I)